MNQPFTAEEIKSAMRSLRNTRSAGDDQIKAELLKSTPDILHELLADIYKNKSETGEHPPELTLGIITLIQKPGKPKRPVQNFRPVTLLSMISKVLAVCTKKRIVDKLNAKIPPSQAAYRYSQQRYWWKRPSRQQAIQSICWCSTCRKLRDRNTINAVARAGKGFGSRRATHHKRTNQHSTQISVWKWKEWCLRNRYWCPSGWLRERKPLYILSCRSTGHQQTWRPWLLQHHSKTTSTHY